ncbi:MAG TPA: EAL domain-containing protein [Solirubrobacteraceae bacterium]|nr:EAL domain-containing protein [Solirubrobacteraceae bacterium]
MLATLGLLLAGALAFSAHVTVHLGGAGHTSLWDHWLYDSVVGLSSLLCLWRARRGPDRLAWAAIGAAIALDWLGDLYWNNFLAASAHPPYPSWADAGWLAYYPPMYAGIMLLLRRRVPRLRASVWLDGLVGALALGSVSATVVFAPLLAAIHASDAALITNLAYPTLDMLLLAFVGCGFVMLGARAGRAWVLLGAGLALSCVADSAYVVEVAKGTYHAGGWLDAGWPLSMALLALAAWTQPPSSAGGREQASNSGLRLLTGLFALLVFGVLVVQGLWRVSIVAHSLATLAIAMLFARLALAEREHSQLLRIAEEAHTDDLTGLANRRSIYDAIETALGRGRRLALLMLDLDRFVELSDTLGRDTGEQLVRQVATRLRHAAPGGCQLARIGDDEFVAVLDLGGEHGDPAALAHDQAGAVAVARALRDALDEPFPLDGLLVTVRASVGVACVGEHASTREALLRCADVAMCRARAQHTGVETYSDDADHRNFDGLLFLSELRRALAGSPLASGALTGNELTGNELTGNELAGGELVLHYQPKVNIADGRLAGVEALVRWQHPRLGLLGAERLVPVAEREGLMRLLTLRVLELALAQQRSWREAGEVVPIAVNLSPSNLIDTRLPIDIASLLGRYRTPPNQLELEITEETVTRDPKRALDVIARIGELGVEFSLDDFGIGFSSLVQLRRLPVRTLKIDRSFIMNMSNDPQDANIVRSTVQLGHSLHLRVVAEGVESAANVAELARCGCDIAQGFYFSRPLPAEQFIAWLHTRSALKHPVDAQQPRSAGAQRLQRAGTQQHSH